MSHAHTNDGDRHIHVSCNTCPCVARNISGERNFQSYPLPYLLQCPIDVKLHTLALLVFGAILLLDDGKQIATVLGFRGIAVDNSLLSFLPLHRQALVGLHATIGPHAIPEVGFAQKGNIHKGHSTHVVAEDKDVAGESQGRAFAQLKFGNHPHLLLANGTLGSRNKGQVDATEEIAIAQETFFLSLGEHGVESAQVAADAVLLQSAVDEPCLEMLNHVGRELVEGKVDIIAERLEASIDIAVGAGSAMPHHQLLVGHLLLKVHEYSLGQWIAVEGIA